MSFWDNLVSGLGGGENQQQRTASEAEVNAQKNLQGVGEQAKAYGAQQAQAGQGFDTGQVASMGANAADTMQKANASAAQEANKQAQTAATQTAADSASAAKAGGLNAAQAGAAAGQKVGGTYTGVQQNAQNQGVQNYMGATQQFGQAGAERANRAMTSTGQQVQAGTAQGAVAGQQYGQGTDQSNKAAGTVGGLFEGLLSDVRKKKNIKKDVSLDSILAKLKPINFEYKKGVDANPGKQVGISAQQLEQTPLKGAVIETPEGKKIDASQLTGANTALIIELAGQVRDLRKQLTEKGIK